MKKITKTNIRIFFEKIVVNLIGVYVLITIFIAMPYYNWQYAHENGFVNWILMGESVPTLKSTFWPIIVCYDMNREKYKIEEKHKLETYLSSEKAILNEIQEFKSRIENETNQAVVVAKTDRMKSLKMISELYLQLATVEEATVSKLERLNPPTFLIALHKVELSGLQDEIPLLQKLVHFTRSGDEHGSQLAVEKLMEYTDNLQKRRKFEISKLHQSGF